MLSYKRLFKRIHILGTAWFLVCAAALLIISLRQAGVSWWLVFSISGYSAVLLVFLLAFYLFALFRGVVRAQYVEEHPLSTTPPYLLFYDAAPFLGALAGIGCSFDSGSVSASLRMITEGTLGMTFLTWVVIDSTVAMVESMLPTSRLHRARRMAAARIEKQRIQEDNAALLKSLEQREQAQRLQWADLLSPVADALALSYCSGGDDLDALRQRTIEAGSQAWRMGGIACMRFLHQQIIERMNVCAAGRGGGVNYATYWWDGIGAWRRPQMLTPVCTVA